MIILYFMVFSVALFAIGIAGVVASRNFLVMILSIEVAMAASALLALSMFYYVASSDIIILLLAVWAVASAEVIALVAVYRHMVKQEVSLDVTKLSKLKN